MTNDVDIEERIEIKKLIGESKSNLESAKLLINNINHLHWHTIADLWNGLADTLEKRGYEVTQKPSDENYTDIVHGSTRKKNNASLVICIKTVHPYIIKMEEYNDEWFYFGVEKDKKIPKQYVQAFKSLVANDDNYEAVDNWYIWKYPSINEDEKFNSWDIHNDVTFNLINDDFRQRITSVIIDDIDRFIEDVNNQIKATKPDL
jgi:hypothetical protein